MASSPSPRHAHDADWHTFLGDLRARIHQEHLPLIAAGVAFFAILAVVPGLLAVAALYGLVADPSDVTHQVTRWATALSPSAQHVLRGRLTQLATTQNSTLGTSLLISLVGLLWSASSGMAGLLKGLTLAMGVDRVRAMVRVRGAAVGYTLVALAVTFVAFLGIAGVPPLLDTYVAQPVLHATLTGLRWVLVGAVVETAIAALYRYGPNRGPLPWRAAAGSAVAATLIWLAGSGGFALYVRLSPSFDGLYGALGGAVALLLWLYVSCFVLLLGGALAAELEERVAAWDALHRPR